MPEFRGRESGCLFVGSSCDPPKWCSKAGKAVLPTVVQRVAGLASFLGDSAQGGIHHATP